MDSKQRVRTRAIRCNVDVSSKFETFRSTWKLLTKNDAKTFDELTMFQRNFRKTADSNKFEQEAKSGNQNKAKSNYTRSKKEDSCNYCKKKGHWVRDCRKWISDGRPPRAKTVSDARSNALDTNLAVVTLCNEVYTTEVNAADWWIDNGATRHVTNLPNQFVEFIRFDNPCVIRSAGEETLRAIGKGTIQIVSTVNRQLKTEIKRANSSRLQPDGGARSMEK